MYPRAPGGLNQATPRRPATATEHQRCGPNWPAKLAPSHAATNRSAQYLGWPCAQGTGLFRKGRKVPGIRVARRAGWGAGRDNVGVVRGSASVGEALAADTGAHRDHTREGRASVI